MDISEQLYEILYEKEPSEAIGMIGDCTDSIFLHQLIANYNWDNGTALPEAVAENSCCDMGTALMIFELYGGYDHLLDSRDSAFTDHEKSFLSGLIEKISNDRFACREIKYTPELSRADKYRIKKSCPDLHSVFIDGTDGRMIEVISV